MTISYFDLVGTPLKGARLIPAAYHKEKGARCEIHVLPLLRVRGLPFLFGLNIE